MQSFFSYKGNRAVVMVAFVTLSLALLSYSYYTMKQARYSGYGPTTINVTGEGEAVAKPDIGSFNFSVNAEAAEASVAQSEAANKLNTILDYLRQEGVEEKDINTSYYSLQPRYRRDTPSTNTSIYYPPEMIQDGFTVNQGVTVKVRNIDVAGELIAGVGELGASNISSLNFVVDNDEVLVAEARSAAIADAKTQAEQIAKDLGVRLVRITGYYDESDYYYGGGRMEMSMVASDGGRTTPEIPVGESTTYKRVSVTFEVR